MSLHARRRRWHRLTRAGTITGWFLGLAAFAYWTIQANPILAGIAALAAATFMGAHIYLADRNNR